MQDALGNCSSTVRTIVEKWKQLILTGSNSAVEGAVSGLHCLYVPYQTIDNWICCVSLIAGSLQIRISMHYIYVHTTT